MKTSSPSSLNLILTRPLSNPQGWVWGAILLSVLICGAISALHFRQQETLSQTVTALENIREARIDLAKGFLYTTLTDDPALPFNRDQGLALLQQAITSLEKSLEEQSGEATRPLDPIAASAAATFPQSVEVFRLYLAEWVTSSAPSPRLETGLRIAFFNLERHADQIDMQTKQNLQELSTRLDFEFSLTLGGAAFLLTTICGVVFMVGRAKEKSEAALRVSMSKYQTLFECLPLGLTVTNQTGQIVEANPKAEQLLGISYTEHLHYLDTPEWHIIRPDGSTIPLAEYAGLHTLPEKHLVENEELGMVKDNGEVTWLSVTAAPLPLAGYGVVIVYSDITARKQLEAEKESLRGQLYQIQKTEAIGQLAGGIAHDFNNLLVPIIGYAELGMQKLASDSQLYTDLGRIKAAAGRAANLTRQILAFSRQQVLEMKPVDLNQVIIEFEEMLQRLIGEDITLKIHLAPSLPPIRADKGQLEQVLLNLVVNARDAMPTGGTLIIETAYVVLDKVYVDKHPRTQAGPQVLLAVSDTGHGMDAATQQRIFEPFFTTKMVGQGTGLGLPTVFGIVKQHGGNIWVYSEPGRGTTFKIYLPLTNELVVTAEPESPPVGSLCGTETILVVEDEARVRQLVCETLQAHGYRVLATEEPEKALALAAAYEGQVHLLLTDIVLPAINGHALYLQLASLRSDLKVLYMSGYTNDIIVHHGILDEDVTLLQKPFTIHDLLQKVNAVLAG